MSDLDTLTLRELHEPGFPKIGIIGRPSLEIQLHKDAFFRKLKKITESAERGDEEAQKQLDDLSKNFPEYKNSLPSDSVPIEKRTLAASTSAAPTTDPLPSAAPLSLLTGHGIKGGSAVFPTRTPIDHTKAPLTPSHTSEDIEVALVLDLGEKPKIQHLAPSSTSTAIESSSAANHRKRPVSTEEAPSLAPQPTRTNSEDRPLKKPTTRTASA